MGLCQGTYGSVYEPREDPTRVEQVVIYLDDAEDQVVPPAVGKNYAKAEPPMQQDVRPAVEWLGDDDDEYRPAEDVFSSHSSLRDLEKRLNAGEHISVSALARVDQHAKQASRTHGESYHSLLAYLTTPITDTKIRELLTARALIVWLANQNVAQGKGFGPATINTPNGYLQLQQEKKATYAAFFATLCRKADLQCSLIQGVCKAGDYQPGDTELEQCNWVAVRVQGNWQIVHPYWVCCAMIGQTTGGWIKLEADGRTVSQPEKATQGKIQSAFKETYFFPKPEDFKYVCYPDEAEWQLLPPQKRLKNHEQFLRLPFLLPAFFGLGLNLLSLHCCELETKTGLINIVIQCRKSHAFKMVMTYDLFIKEAVDSDDEMLQAGNLPRLVLNSRCEEKFSFQIRFPVEGIYKIVFYAGFYGKPLIRVCEFKLTCEKRLPDCQLLPINTGFDGWGPGPKSERAGLLMATHQGGVIHMQAPGDAGRGKPGEGGVTAGVKFSLDQEKMKTTEYSAEMVGGGAAPAPQELNKHVTCDVNVQTNELDVRATVKDPGEYALVIKAGKKGQRKRSVCNYLLTTLQGIREGVPQRKARKALQSALSGDSNLDELTDLMERCRKAKLDDNDDDIRAAKQRHTFLLVKQHLQDCVKRRNLDVTNRSLKEVSKYRHKLALMVETRRVEKLKQQLERLGGFTRDVPQLNKACEELIYLSNAKPEVHCTMKTLFMLLEESVAVDPRLDEWGHVQSLLRLAKDQANNVLTRMKKISEREMDARHRRKIHAHLHQYTESQVRHASQAAASFYIWIDGVLAAFGEVTYDQAGVKQQTPA